MVFILDKKKLFNLQQNLPFCVQGYYGIAWLAGQKGVDLLRCKLKDAYSPKTMTEISTSRLQYIFTK